MGEQQGSLKENKREKIERKKKRKKKKKKKIEKKNKFFPQLKKIIKIYENES